MLLEIVAKEVGMEPVVSSVEISRRPEDVFAYVTDPSHLPEWQESVVSARGGTPPTLGSKVAVTRRIGRMEKAATSELTAMALPEPGPCAVRTVRSAGMSTVPSSRSRLAHALE
jgi:hypothetical protein